MKDILEKHSSEVARLIFIEFDEAKQSKKQTRLAIEEAERLRKILEANG